MLRYALYRLQLAHAVGEYILRRGSSDELFPNDFEEDLLLSFNPSYSVSESINFNFVLSCY